MTILLERCRRTYVNQSSCGKHLQRYSQAQRSTASSATMYSPDLPHRMDECLEAVAGVLANIEIFFRSSCRTENPPRQGGGVESPTPLRQGQDPTTMLQRVIYCYRARCKHQKETNSLCSSIVAFLHIHLSRILRLRLWHRSALRL